MISRLEGVLFNVKTVLGILAALKFNGVGRKMEAGGVSEGHDTLF
jgi:hypothetical protein